MQHLATILHEIRIRPNLKNRHAHHSPHPSGAISRNPNPRKIPSIRRENPNTGGNSTKKSPCRPKSRLERGFFWLQTAKTREKNFSTRRVEISTSHENKFSRRVEMRKSRVSSKIVQSGDFLTGKMQSKIAWSDLTNKGRINHGRIQLTDATHSDDCSRSSARIAKA